MKALSFSCGCLLVAACAGLAGCDKNEEPPKDGATGSWTQDYGTVTVQRKAAPGGWLYVTTWGKSVSTTFVPAATAEAVK